MFQVFFKIIYDKEDDVCKYVSIKTEDEKSAYNTLICSWFEKTFYDEVSFVIDKEIDCIKILKKLVEQNAVAISKKEFELAFKEVFTGVRDSFVELLYG